MKNKIFWFLILSIFIFIWGLWLLWRDISEKNILENDKNFSEEKEVIFQKYENNNFENSWFLDWENESYAYFYLSEEKFYFDVVWEKLELKNFENSIWFFDFALKKDLNILEIFWDWKIFLIEIWDKKYIYSKKDWLIKNFETKLKIDYGKKSDWNFIFFSDWKWAFVLYKDKNEIEYFSLFLDFVFYKNWYIWIISENDYNRFSRFDVSGKNIILYFEPKTWDKKIIYNLDFLPKKIWQEDGKIFLENNKNEKFSIENY